MRRLLGLLAASLTLLCLQAAGPAFAQSELAQAVSACGTPNNTPVVGSNYPITASTGGLLCVNAVGGSGTLANQVQGTSASGATDDGSNPVKVGGAYNTTGLALTTGQRGNLQLTPDGSLRVVLDTAAAFQGLTYPGWGSDAIASGTVGMASTALQMLYNGATIDRSRSIIGAVAAGTGTNAVSMAPNTSANSSTTAVQCTVACASVNVSGVHNIYGLGFSSTVAGWLLLEDATACAANGTVTPLRAYAYPTASVTTTVTWGDIPRSVATGISLCFSTTGPYTATSSTTAFIWADYK